VTDAPVTHYTRSADGTNLAYQVSGDGAIQIMFLHWLTQSICSPTKPVIRRRLGAFSREVWADLRGMSASEGDPGQSLAGKTSDDDLTAVLDAVGLSDRR
jgi:hypothetical protein